MFHAHVRYAFVAVGALLLLAAGCAGVENEPNFAKAVDRTEATGSVGFEINALGTENGRPIELSCDGAADYGRKRFRLACDEGQRWTMDTIVIDDATYFRGTGALGFDSGGRWRKESSGVNDFLPGFSPERLLDMLRSASRQTERIGEEDVRGEQTVRYRLTVSCAKAELSCPGDEAAPVEVWIGGDGLVRRIWVEDSDLTGTIEFFDFGVKIDIEPPPADQTSEIAQCSKGEPKPISERQALEALRRHGFRVRREGAVCEIGVAAVITNADREGVLEREGILHCFLSEQPEEGAPKNVVRRGVDGGDAQLLLANLTCSILADSPKAEEKIRPLDQAFEELERAIRP
jgi:hypothetical protein